MIFSSTFPLDVAQFDRAPQWACSVLTLSKQAIVSHSCCNTTHACSKLQVIWKSVFLHANELNLGINQKHVSIFISFCLFSDVCSCTVHAANASCQWNVMLWIHLIYPILFQHWFFSWFRISNMYNYVCKIHGSHHTIIYKHLYEMCHS